MCYKVAFLPSPWKTLLPHGSPSPSCSSATSPAQHLAIVLDFLPSHPLTNGYLSCLQFSPADQCPPQPGRALQHPPISRVLCVIHPDCLDTNSSPAIVLLVKLEDLREDSAWFCAFETLRVSPMILSSSDDCSALCGHLRTPSAFPWFPW